MGYTDMKAIYLSELAVTNLSTILEEVVHYCTGARDISKDFQDKVVSIAAHLMELVL
jgi:hypothetical protein